MIELRNLTKSYRADDGSRRYVFRDLSFSFPSGMNIALIGRNGAGKSTLMRLLGGIDTPDSGMVVTDKSISWPVGLSGGFQGTLSGRDNVKFVCRIYGASGVDMHDRVRFVEDFAEIGDYFDQPVKSYSSGMRSRLAFGLSMAFDFDYYLIDEVMAVGDAQFKRKSKAVLEERLHRSKLILVTHNMVEVDKLCDVVVLVQDGQAALYSDVRAGIRAYQGDVPKRSAQGRQPQAQGPMRRGQLPGDPRGKGQPGPGQRPQEKGNPSLQGRIPTRQGGQRRAKPGGRLQWQEYREGGSRREQDPQSCLPLSPALGQIPGDSHVGASSGRADFRRANTDRGGSSSTEGDER